MDPPKITQSCQPFAMVMARAASATALLVLRAMIIKLYKQMTEIRLHAEKDCRKILWPESDFSPTIQMWYDRIHAYLQLIRLKEGKASNASNIVRFAKRTHIERPVELTMEEEDGL